MPPQDLSTPPAAALNQSPLAFGLTFADLAARDGLIRLDRLFLDKLVADDATQYGRQLEQLGHLQRRVV